MSKLPKNDARTKKPPAVTPWTPAEDHELDEMYDDCETWEAIAIAISTLGGSPRSPAQCLQRLRQLKRNRPQGFMSLKALSDDGIEVLISFPDVASMRVRTRRTMREMVEFLNESSVAALDTLPPAKEVFIRLEGSAPPCGCSTRASCARHSGRR